MFAAMRDPEMGLTVFGLISIVYLVLVFMSLRGTRPLELKLLWAGLLTGLMAVWSVPLAEEQGASIQVRAGLPGDTGRVLVGSDAGGTLGRIAVVLILGSIAVGVLSHRDSRSTSSDREEANRGNPD